MASLELHRVTKAYGTVNAVDGVDLHVDHGKLVCLLGPSGCGKTTTLRLVAGFIEPTGGEIRVGSRVVSSARGGTLPPERRNMSMIFQSYALWPHMTIASNVAYGLKFRKVAKADSDKRVRDILRVVQMEHMAERYPSELSGGQQQRVALARALVVAPETLLLDEPLSNLDANLRDEMRFEIRRLHDAYKYTTLYVTHDQSEAMATADMIVVMNKGKIEQVGSPREIYELPRTEFVAKFIGGTNVLHGKPLAADRLSLTGFDLSCNDQAKLDPSRTEGAVSIRTHHIGLSRNQPSGEGNAAPGKVVRRVYVGAAHDYLIALDAGPEVRVTTPSNFEAVVDDRVWATFPREHCLALS